MVPSTVPTLVERTVHNGLFRFHALLALVAACLSTSAAGAQPLGDFQVEQFEPLPAQNKNTLNVSRSDVLAHLTPSLGLFLHFADDPMVLYRVDESGERTIAARVVDDQLKAELTGAFGLFERAELGLALPIVLYQKGGGDAGLGGDEGFDGAAIADLRVIPKVRILEHEKFSGFGLAFSLPMYVPIGSSGSFNSDGEFRFEPRIAADYRFSRAILAANLAYQVRPEAFAHNYTSDDSLRWALAAEVGVGPEWLAVQGSLFGSYTLADGRDPDDLGDVASNTRARPIEALLGLKYYHGNITWQWGAGFGLTSSVGAPDFRLFAGIGWSPSNDDRDGDGIKNGPDKCPDTPEDADGFEDDDGCPDLDDDKDGIADTDDECRTEPEDTDGFEDANGCPDPDNDQDGVLDGEDNCPVVPGTPDLQGCPDTDGDGFMDDEDQCPEDAEDKDGFEDDDGCPEHDNDGDGFLDAEDKCPGEPEVINGVDDDDGCPDEGESKVRVTAEKIEILEKVFFDSGRATIQGRSFDVLNQVASVMRSQRQIRLLRVEGHTDSRGNDDANLELSQRRADAVKVYLEGRGIDAGRLQAVGYGETKPIADNDSSAGRADNRRVEFFIAEQASADGP